MSKNKIVNTSEVEQKIISIWRDVLNSQALSSDENFFDAGGNSLLMSKVHRQIRNKLEIPISIIDLFQYPTVKMISEIICEKHKKSLAA